MTFLPRPILAALALSVMALLSACATPTPEQRATGEIFDPYEENNRSIHAFNVAMDRALLRPASKGYTSIIPPPMVDSFNYFADNISLPSMAVDYVLQGKLKEAGISVARFAVNMTVGIAGLSDPASNFEIPEVETDFGEVLHVWGFGEGAYVELPLYGPSTARDTVGVVVDLFTDPLSLSPVRPVDNLGLYTEIVRRMGDRGRFSDTVDAILYESADSYAQARLIYLQNRRFELGGIGGDSSFDLYTDPYSDPYEDPYGE